MAGESAARAEEDVAGTSPPEAAAGMTPAGEGPTSSPEASGRPTAKPRSPAKRPGRTRHGDASGAGVPAYLEQMRALQRATEDQQQTARGISGALESAQREYMRMTSAFGGLNQMNEVLRSIEQQQRAQALGLGGALAAAQRQNEDMARIRDQVLGPAARLEGMRHAMEAVRAAQVPSSVAAWVRQISSAQRDYLNSGLARAVAAVARASFAPAPSAALDRPYERMISGVVDALRTQREQLGFTTHVARGGIASYSAMAEGWAAVAAGVAVSTSMADLSELDDDVGVVLGEEIDAIVSADAVAVAEIAADDETTLAMLAVQILTRVLERIPTPSDSMKHTLFTVIVGVLIMLYQEQASDRDHGEVMQVLARQEQIALRQAQAADKQTTVLEKLQGDQPAGAPHEKRAEARLIATKARPLMENPESRSRRLGTVPAETTMDVLMRADRWLYVVVVDGETAGAEGWVFLRDLRPVIE